MDQITRSFLDSMELSKSELLSILRVTNESTTKEDLVRYIGSITLIYNKYKDDREIEFYCMKAFTIIYLRYIDNKHPNGDILRLLGANGDVLIELNPDLLIRMATPVLNDNLNPKLAKKATNFINNFIQLPVFSRFYEKNPNLVNEKNQNLIKEYNDIEKERFQLLEPVYNLFFYLLSKELKYEKESLDKALGILDDINSQLSINEEAMTKHEISENARRILFIDIEFFDDENVKYQTFILMTRIYELFIKIVKPKGDTMMINMTGLHINVDVSFITMLYCILLDTSKNDDVINNARKIFEEFSKNGACKRAKKYNPILFEAKTSKKDQDTIKISEDINSYIEGAYDFVEEFKDHNAELKKELRDKIIGYNSYDLIYEYIQDLNGALATAYHGCFVYSTKLHQLDAIKAVGKIYNSIVVKSDFRSFDVYVDTFDSDVPLEFNVDMILDLFYKNKLSLNSEYLDMLADLWVVEYMKTEVYKRYNTEVLKKVIPEHKIEDFNFNKSVSLMKKNVVGNNYFGFRAVGDTQTFKDINESLDYIIETKQIIYELLAPEKIDKYDHNNTKAKYFNLFLMIIDNIQTPILTAQTFCLILEMYALEFECNELKNSKKTNYIFSPQCSIYYQGLIDAGFLTLLYDDLMSASISLKDKKLITQYFNWFTQTKAFKKYQKVHPEYFDSKEIEINNKMHSNAKKPKSKIDREDKRVKTKNDHRNKFIAISIWTVIEALIFIIVGVWINKFLNNQEFMESLLEKLNHIEPVSMNTLKKIFNLITISSIISGIILIINCILYMILAYVVKFQTKLGKILFMTISLLYGIAKCPISLGVSIYSNIINNKELKLYKRILIVAVPILVFIIAFILLPI